MFSRVFSLNPTEFHTTHIIQHKTMTKNKTNQTSPSHHKPLPGEDLIKSLGLDKNKPVTINSNEAEHSPMTLESNRVQQEVKSTNKKNSKVASPSSAAEKDLWSQFLEYCKSTSYANGDSIKTVRIDNDIHETLRLNSVNGHNITTMVNAILRAFLMHFKDQVLAHKTNKTDTLF
jgi:uncharacterized protein (DUF4415 family)